MMKLRFLLKYFQGFLLNQDGIHQRDESLFRFQNFKKTYRIC